jgi:hypothetical protein
MTERYSAEDIPGVLDRLIEAWHDHEEASRQLEEYKRDNPQPRTPGSPIDVDTLQVYHRRKMNYEAGLKKANSERETARKHFEELQEEVRLFLPQGPRVRHKYEGGRDDIKGSRYVIQYRGREFIIEPYSEARRRGGPGVDGGRP